MSRLLPAAERKEPSFGGGKKRAFSGGKKRLLYFPLFQLQDEGLQIARLFGAEKGGVVGRLHAHL